MQNINKPCSRIFVSLTEFRGLLLIAISCFVCTILISTNFQLRTTVKWQSIKALLIGFSLTAINLFSGTFAMINYTANIFEKSGSTLDKHVSSIIVAVIQIVGVYGSTNLVDRIGRKTLLTFSTFGAFIGLMSLGTFSYLSENGYDLSNYNFVPLVSFSTFVFISCFGILPLPFIVISEILPAEVSAYCVYYISFTAIVIPN